MTGDRAPRTYRVTLEDLESTARVPLDQQVETQASHPGGDGPGTWDEQQRQVRLAGGA